MNNPQLPAYPTTESINHGGEVVEMRTKDHGFTKLELGSLMIAQGLATRELFEMLEAKNYPIGVAKLSVSIVRAVLEEANK
jgi:hypothetical protein